MKIRINDKVFDSAETMMMIVFEDNEKKIIQNMDEDNTRFCIAPAHISSEAMKEFMGPKE